MHPIYTGIPRQHGHGLGSVFKSLFKSVAPLIKPLASRVMHTLKTEGVRHGAAAVQDLMSGARPKRVLKSHGLELGKQLLGSIKGPSSHARRQFSTRRRRGQLNQKGRGRVFPKKRKAKRKSTRSSKRRRLDIFD